MTIKPRGVVFGSPINTPCPSPSSFFDGKVTFFPTVLLLDDRFTVITVTVTTTITITTIAITAPRSSNFARVTIVKAHEFFARWALDIGLRPGSGTGIEVIHIASLLVTSLERLVLI